MKLLPALGLSAVALYILSKISFAAGASRLNYTIISTGLAMNGLNLILSINLTLQNPTNQTFNVNAIVANTFVNGTMIGNIAGFNPVVIGPTSQATIPVKVMISDLSIVNSVIGIYNGTTGTAVQVHIIGTVNANGSLLPIDVNYQVL